MSQSQPLGSAEATLLDFNQLMVAHAKRMSKASRLIEAGSSAVGFFLIFITLHCLFNLLLVFTSLDRSEPEKP